MVASSTPRTRYASRDNLDIAYQVLGDGPIDLVMIPAPFIPIDWIVAEPSLHRLFGTLSSFSRVIRFDHRGTGMSSRVPPEAITTSCLVHDVTTVMDDLGSQRAIIFGSGFKATSALAVAADNPDRVAGLIVVNGTARPRWAADYPIGVHPSAAGPLSPVVVEPDALERGFDILGLIAPSVADNRAFRAWWDTAGNRAMSPSMARHANRTVATADVRDKLDLISTRTRILHRQDAVFVPVSHGCYLAERIAGARHVELPGADALYWTRENSPILGEIEEFVTGARAASAAERMLTTIVFTDIADSTAHAAVLGDVHWRDLPDTHDTLVRYELGRFGGREVNTAGDGIVATFNSPSVALDCPESVVKAVAGLGIDVRIGATRRSLGVLDRPRNRRRVPSRHDGPRRPRPTRRPRQVATVCAGTPPAPTDPAP